jgi:hypothetical protein
VSPLTLLGNSLVITFPQQRNTCNNRIVGCSVFCVVHVVLNVKRKYAIISSQNILYQCNIFPNEVVITLFPLFLYFTTGKCYLYNNKFCWRMHNKNKPVSSLLAIVLHSLGSCGFYYFLISSHLYLRLMCFWNQFLLTTRCTHRVFYHKQQTRSVSVQNGMGCSTKSSRKHFILSNYKQGTGRIQCVNVSLSAIQLSFISTGCGRNSEVFFKWNNVLHKKFVFWTHNFVSIVTDIF